MKMPPAIERSVRKQNIKFMHNRNQFSPEYFHFVRKLVSSNIPSRQQISDKPVSNIVIRLLLAFKPMGESNVIFKVAP